MICKKCGMELIEGIDICPFCGEDNKTEENNINNIVNDLNDLKMDIPETVDQKEEQEIEIGKDEEKELFETIDKKEEIELEEDTETNKDYSEALNEVGTDDNKVESISTPNIDDYLNSDVIRNTNIEEEKKVEPIDINEVLNRIKALNNEIDNDFNGEETAANTNDIDISEVSTNEEENNEETISNEIKEDTAEKVVESPFNIENLISYLNTVPVEEVDESKELNAPIIGSPISITDIKNVEVDEIDSLEESQSNIENNNQEEVEIPNNEIVSDSIEENESVEQTNTEEVLNDDTVALENIEQPQLDVQETTEETTEENIEPTSEEVNAASEEMPTVNVEENNEVPQEDDTIRLQEQELKLEEDKEQEPEVYINPLLETVDPPKMPDIPVVLPQKEEKPEESEDINLNPQATQILMPEDIKPNTQVIENSQQEKMPQEPKKSSNSMTVLLFICMIALGVAVALVVSYIFNM